MSWFDKIVIEENVVSCSTPYEPRLLKDVSPGQHFGQTCLEKLQESLKNDGDNAFCIDAGKAKSRQSLSRGELLRFSTAFAFKLRNEFGIGTEKGHIVHVALPNCVDYIAYLLGIWLAGGIPSLTCPTCPTSNESMIVDTKAKVILCMANQEKQYEEVASQTGAQILPAGSEESMESSSVKIPEISWPFDINDTAVIFWSSGTTGKPKGIQHSFVYLNFAMIPTLGDPRSAPTNLFCANMSHIGGFRCALSVMLSRVPSVFITNEDLKDDVSLVYRACNDHPEIDQVVLTTHHMHRLAELDVDVSKYNLGSVKKLFPVGAAIPASTVQKLREVFTGVTAIGNVYTTTEIGCFATMSLDVTNLGLPFPGVYIRIVDPESGDVLPIGSMGEIHIKSPFRMVGYLNNPAANDEAVSFPGQLMYEFVHKQDVMMFSSDHP